MHLLSRRRRTEVLRSAKNVVILSEVGSFALRMIQRSRRTPCNLTSAPARQGVLSVLPLPKCFPTSIFTLRGKGSFDSVRTSLRLVLTALRMTWLGHSAYPR